MRCLRYSFSYGANNSDSRQPLKNTSKLEAGIFNFRGAKSVSISPRKNVLCRYRYDPLDRLVNCAPSDENGIQRFYCRSRLTTEIQGALQRSIFQHDNQLLAQRRREDAEVGTTLLATDQQRSVLNVLDVNRTHPLAYTPYGHRPPGNGLLSLLGFNGERADPVTGHYLLGMGYRAFNPVLMCFNSPDEMSPFDRGGINSYAYCLNDPINRKDPSGYFSLSSLTKPFTYFKRLATRPYYRAASKARSAASEPLKNHITNPNTIHGEDYLLKIYVDAEDAQITRVMSKKDLTVIKPNLEHKFILTRHNELIVSSHIVDGLEPKHAAIARFAALKYKLTDEIVSAGVITKVPNGYQITNNSGHYMPPPESNTLAKFKLRSLGANATSKNHEIRSGS